MPSEPTADVMASRLRRVEARVAALEDCVGHYGPPDGRPLLSLRVPKAPTLTPAQTTLLVYALLIAGVGLYGVAKTRADWGRR